MNNAPPQPPSDPIYKRLYAFARMVEDLLRSLFGADLDADYRTLEQGMAHERQLLRRQAATRFDSATADRLAVAIGTEADPQRLMEVGEAIARCATGGELLREIGSRR